jgi:hypothetical protein
MLETGEYSSFALNNLRHQQHLYLEAIGKCQDPSPADGFPVLLNIIDTPAVRVAEFILLYSKPKAHVTVAMFLRFIRDWRRDLDEVYSDYRSSSNKSKAFYRNMNQHWIEHCRCIQ